MRNYDRLCCLLFALVFTFCGLVQSQVAVNLTPLPPTFYYNNGGNGPLAFGCVFTYAAGSTSPLATYTDATGTTANANPVILNFAGWAQIWFQTGALYDVKVVAYGGTNCSSGLTQYTARSVNQSVLNLNNTWFGTQTFASQIIISPLAFQIKTGVAPNQTILSFPAASGGATLTFPNSTQNILGNISPSITTPVINGCGMENSPGAYICIANNSTTATVLNHFAYFASGAPTTVSVLPASATTGAVGICSANCGSAGVAVIQQTGTSPCAFDGATTAGDYVQASSTPGSCHDAGGSFGSLVGQVLGQVLSTNGGAGTYTVALSSSSTSSSTGVYSAAGATGLAHTTVFSGVLSGGSSTVTFTGAAAWTIFEPAPFCVGNDQTTNNAVSVVYTAGSSSGHATVTGTSTDVFEGICIGFN